MPASAGPPVLALALGGGGARGLAHAGILEVLVAEGLAPDRIYGVSAGAIVGAVYAFEPDPARVLPRALAYLNSEAFRRYVARIGAGRRAPDPEDDGARPGILRRLRGFVRAERVFHRMIASPSLVDGEALREVVTALLPDADVADARVPLTIVALDLVSGREVEITRGPLREAVLGSASLPGIFPPIPFDDFLLADVGVVSAVPCPAARRGGADVVVAADVARTPARKRAFPTAVDVLLRAEEAAGSLFRGLVLGQADVVVRPDVSRIDWTDFSTMDATIALGRDAARAAAPDIRAALARAAARRLP